MKNIQKNTIISLVFLAVIINSYTIAVSSEPLKNIQLSQQKKSSPLLWTGSYIFSEGRGRIRTLKDGFERYGYIDSSGKMVIQPKYLDIGNFSQGLAPVKFISQKYGFIDRSGNIFIRPRFDLAYGFIDGLAVVEIARKRGVINRSGKFVIQPIYSNTALEFQEGLLAVEKGNLWGFVNKQGQLVIDYQFIESKHPNVNEQERYILNYYSLRFSEGLAVVSYDGVNYGYINRQGQMVIPARFKYAQPFGEGLAMVQTNDGKWGYLDKTGKLTISLTEAKSLQIVEATIFSVFSEGLAGVKIGNKWGYIDRSGQQIIPAQYDNIYAFSEGLAGVVVNGKYGFIDRQGQMVITPQFDKAFSFKSGLAPVVIGEYGTVNARVGYINRLGKMILQQR